MKIKDIVKTLKGRINIFIKRENVWIEVFTTDYWNNDKWYKYWNYEIEKIYARDCNIFDVYLKGEFIDD